MREKTPSRDANPSRSRRPARPRQVARAPPSKRPLSHDELICRLAVAKSKVGGGRTGHAGHLHLEPRLAAHPRGPREGRRHLSVAHQPHRLRPEDPLEEIHPGRDRIRLPRTQASSRPSRWWTSSCRPPMAVPSHFPCHIEPREDTALLLAQLDLILPTQPHPKVSPSLSPHMHTVV